MEGLKRGRIVYFWEYGQEFAAVVTHVNGHVGNGTTINCYVFPDGLIRVEGVLKQMVAFQPMPELGQQAPQEHTWHWMFPEQPNRYDKLRDQGQDARMKNAQENAKAVCAEPIRQRDWPIGGEIPTSVGTDRR